MPFLKLKHEFVTPDIGCVHLAGRLDIPGVEEISLKFTAYTATQRKPVIINLSDVTLITSMGLGMLIANANSLKCHGAPMILLNPQPNVEKVIKLAGLSELLPIEYDVQAAIKRISQSSS